MSRAVSATISSAIAGDTTRPIYLLEIGYSSTVRICTFDADIIWSGYSWESSGVEVRSMSSARATLEFPNGDSDPWLALALVEGTRDVTLNVYEHHYDATSSPQGDAVLVFSGVMDEATITDDKVVVRCIESSQRKTFPPNSVDDETFTYLMTSGDRVIWGNDVLTVN